MYAIHFKSHGATSSAGSRELTGAPQLLYSAHQVLLSTRSQNTVTMWRICPHVQHVDSQLNIAMRTVCGTLRPTNINYTQTSDIHSLYGYQYRSTQIRLNLCLPLATPYSSSDAKTEVMLICSVHNLRLCYLKCNES